MRFPEYALPMQLSQRTPFLSVMLAVHDVVVVQKLLKIPGQESCSALKPAEIRLRGPGGTSAVPVQ